MMPQEECVYIPPRTAWKAKIAGNPITQLAHTGQVESVAVEHYNKGPVEGWTIRRRNSERILVVSEPTSENPFQAVLYMPGITSLPTKKEDMVAGWRWLQPKIAKLDQEDDAGKLSARARMSWSNNFTFLEESYDGESIAEPGLRAPQIGALYAALAHWKVTKGLGTVVMPTGTGKTEVMLALLAKERPESLLLIVPTAALRDQIADKFLTFGVLQQFGVIGEEAIPPVVGRVEHQFHSTDDANRFLESCNVAVATMAVVGRCGEEVRSAIAKACSHLFIDEAHHSRAATWHTFRELVCAESKPVLQFTATPYRRDGKHVGGKPIFTYPLRMAQHEGYFTRITFIPIWSYNRDLKDEVIAKRAIQVLEKDTNDGLDHIVMARTNNIERAKQVYEIYCHLAPDFSPLIVHSEQKAGDRTSAIEALRGRESRIIVCVDMLGEGFDLPQLKIAALHDVHKSLAITIQFTGRFTRIDKRVGEATIIANVADAAVEEAIRDLYSKDSDWNHILGRMSEWKTTEHSRHYEIIGGFEEVPSGITLENIYPKMSTVVYRTTCEDWMPRAIDNFVENLDLLVEPNVNHTEQILFYITREQTPVKWGEVKNIQDIVHNLYLAHWDQSQELLFINSTNNRSIHRPLAETLAGEDVELIRGEQVYRTLHDINRLILSNLGMLHLLSRAAQFTMHAGSDIKTGLSSASLSNRWKTNLFGRGNEDGKSVTLGAAHKGRIWSHRSALSIADWVEWCHHVGKKLLNDDISTKEILEHVIIPEKIEERPNMVPLAIEWPHYFLTRDAEAVHVEIDGAEYPFYEVGLEITEFKDTGPLGFHVAIDGKQVKYEVKFREHQVQYVSTSDVAAYISVSDRRLTLNDWFQDEPPVITFHDTSQLVYNEHYIPKPLWKPYDTSQINRWTWAGVAIKVEEQYPAKQSELRTDSIQYHVIKCLQSSEAQPNYDIIFDDHGTGEIADIVALKAEGDSLLVHLFHCKSSTGDKPGARVGDFYAVCGQAQKVCAGDATSMDCLNISSIERAGSVYHDMRKVILRNLVNCNNDLHP